MFNPLERLQAHPEYAQRLRDPSYQLSEAMQSRLGVRGYDSLYDFVRQQLAGETMRVAGLNPFYLYDAGFSSRFISEPLYPLGAADAVQHPDLSLADYAVLGERYYRDHMPSWTRQQGWQLVYNDAVGRVLRRIE